MKTIENTLTLEIDTWDDPGDYPSGAGGGPLPSYDFVAGVDGTIVIEIEPSDVDGDPDVQDMVGGRIYPDAIRDWIGDNYSCVDHDIAGLSVRKWSVDKIEGNRATLSVEEFDAEIPGPPEDEYDPMEDYDRQERQKYYDDIEARDHAGKGKP